MAARIGSSEDDREIRLALLRQRRRQRDQDRVGVGDRVVIGGRCDETRIDVLLQLLRRNVPDMAFAAVQRSDRALLDVDEEDVLAGVREHVGERHADVARADDRDVGLHAGDRLPRRCRAIRSDACPSP